MSSTIDEDRIRGGALTAAIANAVVRRTAEYTGRGPTQARAIVRDDVVVVVLQDTLTKGERALVAHGRAAKVMELRREFQSAMGDALSSDIEQLTGRKVLAFMSANHVDPDLGAEVFILDPSTQTHADQSMGEGSSANPG